ncbi:endo-1,3;1,4-beta-D-glucanase [Cannabis sativa]|uniref:endo-1,3;1,4-beta-D-glucanase n=1 Tax=Cannabis sativa TaxID=3483 RepID=UPI0029C9EC1A|nr:endo-1,3;1,4-beta-D-glucanase [Cannabis sativa]
MGSPILWWILILQMVSTFCWSNGAGHLCCSDPPILDPHSGAGHVEKLGGLPSYVIGSPYSKHAAVLISDVYGYEAPNLRKVADKVAAAGFFVAVPDFLKGDPFVRADTKRPMSVWIKDHSTEEGYEFAKVVIQDLKNKGYSAIGVAGFCWGAKAAIQLAKRHSIKAAAILHQSYVTVDDIKEVKVPLAVLGAEFDHPEIVKQFEKVLRRKPKIKSFVKIYPGVRHGWTIRYNITDTYTIKKADEAHHDLIQWFSKYVK